MSMKKSAFTLIELLCVITIIALLAGLVFPVLQRVTDKADVTKCMNNLRQIGMSVNLYAADHNNTLPYIETSPDAPVYPDEFKALPMAEVLKPYGVSAAVLTCPSDLKARLNFEGSDATKGKSFFETKGTSYEWRPLYDGESSEAPKVYTPRGTFNVPMKRIRLALDYVNQGRAPHQITEGESSTYNTLRGDGSVTTVSLNVADAASFK